MPKSSDSYTPHSTGYQQQPSRRRKLERICTASHLFPVRHLTPSAPLVAQPLLPSPQSLQVFEDSDVRVHVSLDTVLGARLFVLIEGTRVHFPRDAFLPAQVGEVVDH